MFNAGDLVKIVGNPISIDQFVGIIIAVESYGRLLSDKGGLSDEDHSHSDCYVLWNNGFFCWHYYSRLEKLI